MLRVSVGKKAVNLIRSHLGSWYDRLKELVDIILKLYENKHHTMFVYNVNILEKENVKKKLKRLQNKYIIWISPFNSGSSENDSFDRAQITHYKANCAFYV